MNMMKKRTFSNFSTHSRNSLYTRPHYLWFVSGKRQGYRIAFPEVLFIRNGVARTLQKLRTSKETTGSISNSLQLRPFSKWELLMLPEGAIFVWEQILFFKSSSLCYRKSLLPH